MLLFCLLVTGLTLAILGMAQFAAVVRFWPYNLELTLAHYSFELEGVGLRDFFNSLVMAGSAAVFGTALVFIGAFVVEKPRRDPVVTTLSAVGGGNPPLARVGAPTQAYPQRRTRGEPASPGTNRLAKSADSRGRIRSPALSTRVRPETRPVSHRPRCAPGRTESR